MNSERKEHANSVDKARKKHENNLEIWDRKTIKRNCVKIGWAEGRRAGVRSLMK